MPVEGIRRRTAACARAKEPASSMRGRRRQLNFRSGIDEITTNPCKKEECDDIGRTQAKSLRHATEFPEDIERPRGGCRPRTGTVGAFRFTSACPGQDTEDHSVEP